MAEPAEEMNHEIDMVQEEEEGGRENVDCIPAKLLHTSNVGELNLLIVYFSLFSLSGEECLNYVESEGKSVKDDEAKAFISRLHTRRHDMNESKLLGRRTPRIQTTIRDSRHGRR